RPPLPKPELRFLTTRRRRCHRRDHMPRAHTLLIGVAGSALLVSRLFAAASGQTPAQQSQPPAAPAAARFADMCRTCHDSTRITDVRRTKAEWEDVLNKMIEKGAAGSDDDFKAVFGYLRRQYGKVFINAAAADEITTTLGLSSKDAEAILAYRKTNGPFQDLEALKKVPEIDVKALDAHKDAIAF